MYNSQSLVNQSSRTTQKTVANTMSFPLWTLAFVAIVALQTPLATAALTYAPRELNATVEGQICPYEEERQEARNQISSDVRTMISQLYPCGSSGWTCIAYFDMTDSSDTCPSPWNETVSPKRVCRRRSPSDGGCEGVVYNATGSYSQICGRMIGYEVGFTDAFLGSSVSIDDAYVDGVSVTYGTPRQHIWTFAAGGAETNWLSYSCPCVTGSTNQGNIPPFVGENYFCEAGVTTWSDYLFFADDPLWDGQGCGPTSSCCAFNSPPWFSVQLLNTTRDAIEVRICNNGPWTQPRDLPVAIELIELYVK